MHSESLNAHRDASFEFCHFAKLVLLGAGRNLIGKQQPSVCNCITQINQTAAVHGVYFATALVCGGGNNNNNSASPPVIH